MGRLSPGFRVMPPFIKKSWCEIGIPLPWVDTTRASCDSDSAGGLRQLEIA
jgi:hypothetical protein